MALPVPVCEEGNRLRCARWRGPRDKAKASLTRPSCRVSCQDCGLTGYTKHMPYKDPEAARERGRRYREANREAIREKDRRRDETRREAQREYGRQYREANREALREKDRLRYGARRVAQQEYREANHEAIRARERRYHEANREKRNEESRLYREANREAILEREHRYHEENRETILARKRNFNEINRQRLREDSRRSNEACRAKVLAHYSPDTPPCCACCGITWNLSIDHINSDGREYAKMIGVQFYRWLVREDFPPGFQVLCRLCNTSKGRNEHCQLDHNLAVPADYNRYGLKASREKLLPGREIKRARQREANHRYYWAHREAERERNRLYREVNRQEQNEKGRRYREANRRQVLGHYSPGTSPCCACCGSTRDLTIDHVNGDGREHRRELFGASGCGHQFYVWLIAEDFPPGYQVLCQPCNSSKGNGQHCLLDHNFACK
jgi:hypothetical protein